MSVNIRLENSTWEWRCISATIPNGISSAISSVQWDTACTCSPPVCAFLCKRVWLTRLGHETGIQTFQYWMHWTPCNVFTGLDGTAAVMLKEVGTCQSLLDDCHLSGNAQISCLFLSQMNPQLQLLTVQYNVCHQQGHSKACICDCF